MALRPMLWLILAGAWLGACKETPPGGDAAPPKPGDARAERALAEAGHKEAAPPDAGGGCLSGCAGADQVCRNGKCETVGPGKDCGTATYGSGLPASGVLYVNGSYSGTSDGSESKPYKTVAEAIAAAPAGSIIAIAAGTYKESAQLLIAKSLELRCRCATQVTIERGIKIKSGNVVIDGCTIANPAAPNTPGTWASCEPSGDYPKGIDFTIGAVPATLLVRDSVIADWCTGLYASGVPNSFVSTVCVARSRVTRSTKGIEIQNFAGVGALPQPTECGGLNNSVAIRLTKLDQSKDYALNTHASAQSTALDGNLVELSGKLGGASGGLGYGVYLGDATYAMVGSNVFRNNASRGLALRNNLVTSTEIVIKDNLVQGNQGAGIAIQKLQAGQPLQISGNLISGTGKLGSEPGGDGIQVSLDGAKASSVKIVGNTIEGSARHGVFLEGVGGTIDQNAITGSSGAGILLGKSCACVEDIENPAPRADLLKSLPWDSCSTATISACGFDPSGCTWKPTSTPDGGCRTATVCNGHSYRVECGGEAGLGNNSFSTNAAGNVNKKSNLLETHGDLPIPLP